MLTVLEFGEGRSASLVRSARSLFLGDGEGDRSHSNNSNPLSPLNFLSNVAV